MRRGTCPTATLALAAIIAIALPALAQEYPSKPITILTSVNPGGVTDWQARTVGAHLNKRWGQPVVVENRPGAGGAVALQQLKRAAPDGHTLITASTASGMLPLFVKDTSYEPGKDIEPVQLAFYAPYVIITNTQVPAKTLKEFIDYARANPGKLNFAAVPNTSQHLDTLNFIRVTGVNIVTITYQGGAPALRALLANEAQAYFGAVFGLDQQVKAGKITPLAVTSSKPFPILPDIPTVKSAIGLDLDLTIRYGFATTAGTPKPIVDKLAREIADIVMKSEMNAQIRSQGYEPQVTTPEEFSAEMLRETRRAREIAQAAGIKPQ